MAQHVDHLDALRTLGLDQKTAAALAAALHDAGISEDNRAATLQRVIDIGCTENDRLRLEQDRARVARELNALRAAVLDGQKAHADIKTEIVDATGQRDGLREDISVLHEEGAQFYDAILSAEALEQFLLRHTARNDRFWATLEHLLTVKRNSPALPQSALDWLTAEMQEQVVAFLQQLARRGAPGVASKTAPGDRSIVPGGGS